MSPAQESLENEKVQACLTKITMLFQNLLQAANQGNLIQIADCLAQGADINGVDEHGYNALQRAITAKSITPEIADCLIRSGIDLQHKTPNQETALMLAQQHLPKMAPLFYDEQVMGIPNLLSAPVTLAELKESFEEHCDRAQKFLDKYPSDFQKVQAMLAYYYWLSKTEPYALYVFPIMFMLSQLIAILAKVEASLPDELSANFSKQQVLEAAQRFFKRTRAMHCVKNELGATANLLTAESGFLNFGYVSQGTQLKREAALVAESLSANLQDSQISEALYKTHPLLFIAGTASALTEFITQVFGMDKVKLSEVETAAQEMLTYERQHRTALQANVRELIGQNLPELVQEAVKNRLIRLPAKVGLKKGLALWAIAHQKIQQKIQQGAEELEAQFVREKAILQEWLAQREAEYLTSMSQLDQYIQALHAADSEVNQQYLSACTQVKTNFANIREELENSYRHTRHKIERNFVKTLVATAAAAVVAPYLAPSLATSLGATFGIAAASSSAATLTLVMEGALTGLLSATFSGNTNRILKDGVMGACMAGFGKVMGSVLEKSDTINRMNGAFKHHVTLIEIGKTKIQQGVITQALVAGMKAGIYAAVDDGKLSTALLNAIGTSIALGGTKELGFMAHMNEKLTAVLVSATVVSAVTHSRFLENATTIGLTTLAQAAGTHLGAYIADKQAKKVEPSIMPQSPEGNEAQRPVAKANSASAGYSQPELLAMATEEASRLLAKEGIHASDTEIKSAFEAHPALQGSPRKIESNLIKLGRSESGSKDTHAAFVKGLEKIFSSTVLALAGVGNAHASELETAQERDMRTYNIDDKQFFAGRFLPYNLSARPPIRIDVLPVSKQPKMTLLPSSEVTQSNATWSKALDKELEAAVRTFHSHDIKVSYDSVVKIFKAHPNLKLSPKGIEDSLIQIGRLDDVKLGVRSSQEVALRQGVEKFIYYNVHDFIKEAQLESRANATLNSQPNPFSKTLFFRGSNRTSERFNSKQKTNALTPFRPGFSGMTLFEDESFPSNETLFRNTENNKKRELNTLAKIGRFSMEVLGSLGRKVGNFARRNPEAVVLAGTFIKASSAIEEYAVAKVVKVIGKEKEITARRNELGKIFENVREELSIAYVQKCNEFRISREDQMGATTIGLFVLSITKSKGAVKLTNKVPLTANQNSLSLTTKVSTALRARHECIPRSASQSTKGYVGEVAGDTTLRRARYDVLPREQFKLPGNRGFDQVAFQRSTDGTIQKILIVESKYSQDGRLYLAQTKTKGKQMSPDWIDKTIENMVASPEATIRKTAEILDINREKWVLKANVLDPNGINRWDAPTRIVEKLHKTTPPPRAPPRPEK